MNLQDVAVVVPTLNCKALLEPALPQLRNTLRTVGEVIVVDSFSTDGTLQMLQVCLDLPHVRFASHPPGLYASWNHGIQQASRPWLHIATAGDVIDAEDLRYLLKVAESSGADVVSSVPRFVAETGADLPDPKWPILELLSRYPAQEEVPLGGPDLVALALMHCRPPHRYNSWLGSSASNLYRTATLQKHPFPEHAGHSGDTLWGLLHAREVRAVFCRRRCGRFVMHTRHARMTVEQRDALSRVYSGPWEETLQRWLDSLGGQETHRLLQHLIEDEVHLKELNELRAKVKRRLPRFLRRISGLNPP